MLAMLTQNDALQNRLSAFPLQQNFFRRNFNWNYLHI